jgi:anti-anti-sigma regulatory factor
MNEFVVAVREADVLVGGDIDRADVDALHAAVLSAGPGAVTVDLRGVTFIGSDGIRALSGVVRRGLRVIASRGSMTAWVLDVVRLHEAATIVLV